VACVAAEPRACDDVRLGRAYELHLHRVREASRIALAQLLNAESALLRKKRRVHGVDRRLDDVGQKSLQSAGRDGPAVEVDDLALELDADLAWRPCRELCVE